MRRSLSALLTFALSVALAVGPLVPPATADVAPQAIRDFTITGTGYGHGIGMSQYGAQGYALKGYTYGKILAHYFQGTSLGTAATKSVKVNLDPDARYNSDGSGGYTRTSWTVQPGVGGAGLKIAGKTHAYGQYRFVGSGSSIVVSGGDISGSITYSGQVTVVAASGGLVQVIEGTGIYGFAKTKYRGSLTMIVSSSKMRLLNVLNIEDYLRGVVPRESPASWHAEALKAQSVAARSYAYVSSGELYCTTSSQAYQGYGAYNSKSQWVGETSATNNAVLATAGKVVKYGGSVVRTYFFSQSGGRTANIEDVWATSSPKPYYKSVADPYENLAKAPYCPWPADKEKHLDGLEMADKLRAKGYSGVPASPAHVTGISTVRAASGYPKYVTFRFSNGVSATIAGADRIRSAFGLLSPMFYFSGFPISRIYGSDRYSTAVQVSRRAFSATAPAVVVASGEDFADALTGSGVAGAANGSLLLSRRAGLSTETSAELKRLSPTKIYLMGSSAALSSAVERQVKAAVPGATVKRLGGVDRYDTSAKAAAEVATISPPAKAILVSGTSWPDAAASSAMAYAQKYPILLTRQAALAGPAATALKTIKPGTVIVAGSETVVSKAAADAAANASGGSVLRLAGNDRYATSAAIARHLTSATAPEGAWSTSEVYLATGGAFPDALSGGVLAGKTRHPMLLTRQNGISGYTSGYLRANRATIGKLWIFGSNAAVSNSGFAALDAAMLN